MPMKSDRDAPVIRVSDLAKRYRIGSQAETHDNVRDVVADWCRKIFTGTAIRGQKEEFWALQDISFDVRQGEVLGIIGRNGAGKSTLLKILSRITEPTRGEIRLRGRLASLLEVGVGFHPELTGRENIYLNGAIIGMTRPEIDARLDEIVAFAEIEKFMETPVKRYSSGMYVRLAFAVAAHLEPELLLIDEVLAVGDIAFQKKCLGRMNDVATREGRTVLFVSHNMAAVRSHACRAIVLEGGRIVFNGETDKAINHYLRILESNTSHQNLRERTDRQGSGRMRFTRVGFRTEKGSQPMYVTGDEFFIDLDYEAEETLENVTVSVPIYTPENQTVFQLYTRLRRQDFARLPLRGRITISIPRLPLRSGRYMLNLWGEINGVLADWVQEAALLEVDDGDFFRERIVPPPNSMGLVVVPHEFSFAAL